MRIMQTMFGKVRGSRRWVTARRRGKNTWGSGGRENALKRITWLVNVR
jgi:hypothetical protein